MYNSGCNAYRHSAVNTVEDKNVILLKLYDGMIRFLTAAKKGVLEGRANVRGENISKTMAIITELECALDMEQGGQLAQQLASLYQYAMGRLTHANRHNDMAALVEVLNILTTLKEGFEGAFRQQPVMKAAPRPEVMGYRSGMHQEGLRFAV